MSELPPRQHINQKIDSRYRIFIWTAGPALLACIVLLMLVRHPIFIATAASSGIALILIVWLEMHRHVSRMRQYLGNPRDQAIHHLDAYLTRRHLRWENSIWIRIIVGLTLALAFLFFMIIVKDRYWAQIMAGWFVPYILSLAALNWNYFTEQILLHEVQRHTGDQTSDKSD